MTYDFFIAYAKADSRVAGDLYEALASLGARCFLDFKSLQPGDDWDLALPKAQALSRATVIIISNACSKAFYQREEIAAAVSLSRSSPDKHRVIPVFIGDHPADDIPYGLRVKHGLYLNADSDTGNVAHRLMQTLRFADGEFLTPPQVMGSYEVDLCMCIDLSNSLNWLLTMMRRQLLTLGHDIVYALASEGKAVTRLRVSLVTFGFDDAPVTRSPMIELPSGAAYLYERVLGLCLVGGGAFRSRGLEALKSAISLDWSPAGARRRHIIAVWTDRPTTEGLDVEELQMQWNEMDIRAKRLILFAPDAPAWNFIGNEWENMIWFPVEAGSGLTDTEYGQILRAVTGSI